MRLPSERDDTFALSGPDGRYVVKIANPDEDLTSLRFQGEVLLFLETADHIVPVPRLVRRCDGSHSGTIVHQGQPRNLRVLTWLEGEPLHKFSPNPAQAAQIGTILGMLDACLAGFSGQSPATPLQWDITHLLAQADLAGHVDSRWRDLVTAVLDEFAAMVSPALARLPWQVIHNDFNPHNLLVSPDKAEFVTGVIDFGDMVIAPRINDLAVAVSYQLATPQWREVAGAMIGSCNLLLAMSSLERAVLPSLIKARLALTLMITESHARTNPANATYILRNHAAALEGLRKLSSLSAGDFADFISRACGG